MTKKYAVIDYFEKTKPVPLPGSDYEQNYAPFVDSKRPLLELQNADINNWIEADSKHPLFSEIPDPNRSDNFDIAYGTDPMQKLDIHYLKQNKIKPVIVYIHGGGWISGSKDDSRYAGPTWVSLGYTVVSINYRLAPQSQHPAQIQDCVVALKWVINNISNYEGDPYNIAIAGHSAGGHLTALLVTDTKLHKEYGIAISRIKCWIPMSGPQDLNLAENYYHPNALYFSSCLIGANASKELNEDASPVTYITGTEPPCLILHGGDDILIPRTNASGLYNKLIQNREKDCQKEIELNIINNYWHCNIVVDYGEKGHKPTELANNFLDKYLMKDKSK